MHYFTIVLFGAVQGLTEFLPVSSSGHLVILHALFPGSVPDTLAFDVALHVGTLFALLFVFWKDVWRLLLGFLRSFGLNKQSDDARMFWLVAVGTIPAALVGGLFGNQFEAAVRTPIMAAIILAAVGALFILIDRRRPGDNTAQRLSFLSVLIIGIAQAVALIPGFSRSGMTIMAALFFGLGYREAARFSFILSVPAVFGAALFAFKDLDYQSFSGNELLSFIIGAVTAAIVGALVIHWLLGYFSQHGLKLFGWYRVAIGLMVLAYFLLR